MSITNGPNRVHSNKLVVSVSVSNRRVFLFVCQEYSLHNLVLLKTPVQGGPDTLIDFVLGNPGSGSNVGCLPSLRSSCSLVH